MKIKRISFMHIESRFRDKSDLGNINDMLRYDHCFQWKKDPQIIAYPVFHTKDGSLGGRVTYARWESFAIRIQPNMEYDDAPAIYNIRMDEWISYRHPRKADGPTDDTRLVPVTLAEYQQAKDTNDLAIEV